MRYSAIGFSVSNHLVIDSGHLRRPKLRLSIYERGRAVNLIHDLVYCYASAEQSKKFVFHACDFKEDEKGKDCVRLSTNDTSGM